MKAVISGLIIFLFLVGLVAAVNLVSQQQDTRKSAHEADAAVYLAIGNANPALGDVVEVTVLVNNGVGDSLGALSIDLPYVGTILRYDRIEVLNSNFELVNNGLPYDVTTAGCVASNQVCTTTCECAPGVEIQAGTRLKLVLVSKANKVPGNGLQMARFYFTAVNTGTVSLKPEGIMMQVNDTGEYLNIVGQAMVVTVKPGSTVTPIPPTATPILPTPTDVPCTDSDGGKNYEVKGNTCVGTSCSQDVCNSIGLVEFYCNAGKVTSESHVCGTGKMCSGGECVVAPVNGGWSAWNPASCPTACGLSASSLTRTCTNPAPANGGTDCVGGSTQSCAATTACVCASPLTGTQTLSCPAGQTGSIVQTHTKKTYPDCTWGSWQITANTCTVIPTVTQEPTRIPTVTPIPTNGWPLGDANHDGVVNVADFIIWRREFLTQVGTRSDFTGDGKITFADFGIWRREFLKNLL